MCNISVIIKKSNRRTISLSVQDDGVVLVRAPKYISNSRITGFIDEKRDWLEKGLERAKARREKADRFRGLIDGSQIKTYREKVRAILTDRTNHYAEDFNLSYRNIRISSAKSRWGSCSFLNSLSFNWKIFFAPPNVQDYLVVHELAHTTHKNHKKQFWNLVEKMHPDYKNSRKWLKENSHLLHID